MDTVIHTLYWASPGLVGAAASSLFVSQSTWTTRAEGAAIGYATVIVPVFLLIYRISGPSGRTFDHLPGDLMSWAGFKKDDSE